MITGTHALIYSKNAETDRSFMRDVLGFKGVDAGEGWLIFKLPPAEVGIHPAEPDGDTSTELYLMCDDVEKTIAELRAKGVTCSEPQDHGWGILTNITLPSGAGLGIYQPRHPTAF
jgi:catechol 2,3-dioxygenase-like lactoylglutathione lyase family enzyme